MSLPESIHRYLKETSSKVAYTIPQAPQFQSQVFGNAWDSFVSEWCGIIFPFVHEALGPWGTEPLKTILPLSDGMHAAMATASFDMASGQTRLSNATEGNPGQILEKLTHEFIHGSLSQFPEGDPFTEEGYVDYTTWVLAHAPVWKQHRQGMIKAAELNIKLRRERAMKDLSDYDRKRWAGGLYASLAHGPLIVNRLRMRKLEGNFTW